MQKIEIVCMVRVNGEKVPQESIPREEFNKMLEKKIDETMQNLCFERIRTAEAVKEVRTSSNIQRVSKIQTQ